MHILGEWVKMGTFEISHKMLCPTPQNMYPADFYFLCVIYDILELWGYSLCETDPWIYLTGIMF